MRGLSQRTFCWQHFLWRTVAVIALAGLPTGAHVQTPGDVLIETGTNYMGKLANIPANNTLAGSVEECGQLCRNSFNYTCNLFVFCKQISGCLAGSSGPYPFGTCTLKVQDNVWPSVGNYPLVYDIDRNDGRVPWTSGAPIWFDVPDMVEGWDVIRGADLFGHFDYTCPGTRGTLPSQNQCQHVGTPQEIAQYCEEDPQCRAFAYFSNTSTLPTNSSYSPSQRASLAWFKGGRGFDVKQALASGNPSAVIYWKPGLHAPNIEDSPGVIAGIIIAAVIAAAALGASAWLLLRRQKGGRWGAARPILPRLSKPCLITQSGQALLNETGSNSQASKGPLIPSAAASGDIQLTLSTAHHRNEGQLNLPYEVGFLRSQTLGVETEVTFDETLDTIAETQPPAGWEIAPEQISICQRPNGADWKAGEGSFGQVFRALQDGVTVVAIKRLHNNLDARQRQAFLREIATLRNLHSPHIVQFLGACLQPCHTMLVTEWMDESLWDAMARNHSHGLPTDPLAWYGRGREVAIDVAKGLHHLHSRNLVHLDLKSSNILLRQGVAKIADVGFAKILSQSAHSQLAMGGTWAWAAPEVILGKRSSTTADIYSFGVVMWELVTGESPVRGNARDVIVPSECPPDIKLLLDECFDPDPRKRPTAREIVHRLEASPHIQPSQTLL
ncbi:hypothetical protein WJX74_001672 [Apatococcus lobatus]|uniref:Protein kinase domain-containing protein n=1 Tax=Apatococcus lobatus TaxID=904363 RepID=A0AAW1QK23_9CHLO